MADHNDDDDNQEDRQLLGDRALVCQRAEGGADEYGQDGDDDTGNDQKNDALELVKRLRDYLRVADRCSQTDHN